MWRPRSDQDPVEGSNHGVPNVILRPPYSPRLNYETQSCNFLQKQDTKQPKLSAPELLCPGWMPPNNPVSLS